MLKLSGTCRMGKFKRLGFENFTFHNSSLQFSEKTRIWGAGVVRQRAEFAPLRSGGCGDGKLLTSSASTDPRGTYLKPTSSCLANPEVRRLGGGQAGEGGGWSNTESKSRIVVYMQTVGLSFMSPERCPTRAHRLLSATVCVRGIGRTGSTGRAKPGADAGSVCLVRACRWSDQQQTRMIVSHHPSSELIYKMSVTNHPSSKLI